MSLYKTGLVFDVASECIVWGMKSQGFTLFLKSRFCSNKWYICFLFQRNKILFYHTYNQLISRNQNPAEQTGMRTRSKSRWSVFLLTETTSVRSLIQAFSISNKTDTTSAM